MLLGTKRNLIEYAAETGASIDEIDLSNIEECTDCSIWTLKTKLIPDLDGNLICPLCREFYGL